MPCAHHLLAAPEIDDFRFELGLSLHFATNELPNNRVTGM
jgi:hypothetical protein